MVSSQKPARKTESKVESYRDLKVWQKSMELVTEIYRMTATFPKEELYALVSQMRRAAISVPSNIAEGWGRNSTKEYTNFLRIARGSLLETETQLVISMNLKYIDSEKLRSALGKTEELNRMLNGLVSSLKRHE